MCAYRPDGARAWKQFGSQRTYFVYDAAGRVVFEFTWSPQTNLVGTDAYVYSPEGLVLRLERWAPVPGNTLYYGYVFDPVGSLLAVRQRADTGAFRATRYFWYDAFGRLMVNVSARAGQPTGIEPFGYLARYGVYTDREISPTTPLSFPRVFAGGAYYDAETGRMTARALGDPNPYVGVHSLLQAPLASADAALDGLQLALDVIGIFDPTGLVDLVNAGMYAARGKPEDAFLTGLGVVPVVGDVAKVGKVRRIWKATQPLDERAKRKIWAESRELWKEIFKRHRDEILAKHPELAGKVDVHHRIPLEWAHLFPHLDINHPGNLYAVPKEVHGKITGEWRRFKTRLGRTPTPAEVESFAQQIDERYGKHMLPLWPFVLNQR